MAGCAEAEAAVSGVIGENTTTTTSVGVGWCQLVSVAVGCCRLVSVGVSEPSLQFYFLLRNCFPPGFSEKICSPSVVFKAPSLQLIQILVVFLSPQ